jgi:hypothetical protein
MYNDPGKKMRSELLAWFASEGLLLEDIVCSPEDPEHDEVKVTVRAPVIALSRSDEDYRQCPDPVEFGYPESCLEMMNLEDFHAFVLQWFERAIAAGKGRCYVCNKILSLEDDSKPWDAVFITKDMYCWLLVHFDCKRYLNRDLKGRNPFEVSIAPPEQFDLHL